MIKTVICTVFCSFLVCFLGISARSADYSEIISEYRKYMESGNKNKVTVTELLTGEKSEDDDRYGKEKSEFYSSLPDNLKERLSEDDIGDPVAMSDKADLSSFADMIKNAVSDGINEICEPLAAMLVLIFVSFSAKSFCRECGMNDTVSFIITAVSCICAVEMRIIDFSGIKDHLFTVGRITDASIPMCTALLTTSGHVTSAGITATYISLIASLMQRLYSEVVFPILSVCTALCTAESCLPDGMNFSLSSSLKKLAVFIMSSSSVIFSFVFGIQTFLARSADSIGIRSVKFAVGNMIPIVGGAVSDTVSTVAAGISSVGSVFGVCVIVAVISVLILPAVKLALGKGVLFICSVFAGMLGCTKEEKLFKELSSVSSALIASVICAGTVVVIIMTVFISYGASL